LLVAGLLLSAADAQPEEARMLTDFTSDSADLGWYVVNDNVMGGRSSGGFKIKGGVLHFTGITNTDGGGFSSIRSEPLELDMSAYSGIELRARGDGRRYTWRLATDARWRGREVGYWADFETSDGAWREIRIPFTRFKPQVRGYELSGPALEPGRIRGMGLMIYDNQDGPFKLELDRIASYEASEELSLSQFRWEKRLLVLSAPEQVDDELVKQLDEISHTADDFADRDMLLVTLLDEGQSTAGERVLNRDEVTAMRNDLDIGPGAFTLKLVGKDGSVKLSRTAATAMRDIYGLIDTMPMRRREQGNHP
jgi:NADH dehydrogenase [ubiquinone] 1 alpha subcomplex assembly factor 1